MDPYLSIKDYMATKTFKFSDAYSLEVFDTEMDWKRSDRSSENPKTGDVTNENLTDIFSPSDIKTYGIETNKYDGYLSRLFRFKNCTEFTAPSYKPTEETVKFCNTTRKVYLPNTSSCDPFSIQLSETDLLYARKFIKYCLRKSFYDETYNRFDDSYRPYRYIDKMIVYVWNNALTDIVLTHTFSSCRIADYDYKYELDAAGSKIILPTVSFTYLSYEIDTNPDPMDYNSEWLSKIERKKMHNYKPGQSGAYMGGYKPNASGHGGGYR